MPAPVEGGLAPRERRVPAGPRRGPGPRAIDFCTIWLASVGCSSSHSPSFSLVAFSTSERIETLPSLRLGLTLELRVAELHRDDRREALADVLAEEVVVLLLEQALPAGVLVDDVGEGLLEALLVHAALDGGDAVGEPVEALVVARVPLQRDLDLLVGLGLLEVGDLLEERLLRRVEVPHEVDDAACVLERDLLLVLGPLVGEPDLEARC